MAAARNSSFVLLAVAMLAIGQDVGVARITYGIALPSFARELQLSLTAAGLLGTLHLIPSVPHRLASDRHLATTRYRQSPPHSFGINDLALAHPLLFTRAEGLDPRRRLVRYAASRCFTRCRLQPESTRWRTESNARRLAGT